MRYEIKLSRQVLADLERLAGASPLGATRGDADFLSRRFFEALARLETMPLSCGLAYENRFFREEIRHLLFKIHKGRPYRALFTVRDDEVRIIAVRAPGERPIRPADLDE